MPSCLVRLMLPLLSVALAAPPMTTTTTAPPISMTRDVDVQNQKDLVSLHLKGGDAGMKAIDPLYCFGNGNKNEKNSAEEFQDEASVRPCDDVNLCIENDYGDALAEDDKRDEAITPEEVHLLTQLKCIGDEKDSACERMDFLCEAPYRCLLNCTRPANAKREAHVCRKIDVCEGTHVICMDENGVDQWKNGERGGNVCNDIEYKECPKFYDRQCGKGGKDNSIYFENPNSKDGV